ncbi:hypothetical protein HK101_001334, partial [Irineochytrium annulatum]
MAATPRPGSAALANEPMYPEAWHIVCNWIWIGQLLFALVGCLRETKLIPKVALPGSPLVLYARKRQDPTSAEKPSWLGSFATAQGQFRVVLATHTAFYVLEMLMTSMVTKFSSMAMHHVVAIIIFMLFYFYPGNASVISILPIILHSLYWVTGGTSIPLLGIYNIVLLLAGIIILFGALTAHAWECLLSHPPPGTKPPPRKEPTKITVSNSSGRDKNDPTPTPPRPAETNLGISALALFWVNYVTYCVAYQGGYCPANPMEFGGGGDGAEGWRLKNGEWEPLMWVIGAALGGLVGSIVVVWVAAAIWVDGGRAELA